jgi:hypothetical protein
MGSKKMFVVAGCLALLLAVTELAGATSRGAGMSRFDGAIGRVSEQRHGTQRKARRRMSKRVAAERRVSEGVWGGNHVRLSVREGGANLEFDCAHGEVGAPFSLDAEGRFDLPGTFTREGPGPIRLDRQPPATPARYVGRIDGRTMTLNVRIEGVERERQPFTLTRGSQGRLWKCR